MTQKDAAEVLACADIQTLCSYRVSNFGLREDQKDEYDRSGRWVLAAAVIIGWALGSAMPLPAFLMGFLFAFLAGSMVFNALKEELPEERQSRFWPLALGGTASAVLLVATG